MDKRTLEILELPKVLERLASLAAFSASKKLALELTPTADLGEANHRIAETTEARQLLTDAPSLTIGGAHDVRSQVRAAERGIVLEPADLLDIKSTLIAARVIARTLDKVKKQYPVLSAISGGMAVSPGLVDAISRALSDRGEVLDGASEKLKSIRRELRGTHAKLTDKLQRMIADPKIVSMLQEPIITQREGRYVIPLRAEFKGRVKSIIHDQSSSGATLFVEPMQTVDLNNQLRESALAERDEIRRILAELSGQVGDRAVEISETVDILARLDLAFAKARYAEQTASSAPVLRSIQPSSKSLHPGTTLNLLQARHPLLDPGTVVPIDLILAPGIHVLVITGPNTGGKTVALKTAGLLVLMAQCGLHIPASEGSELSVFESLFADIGDEQSIEQSLSTFSAHIGTIISILEKAGNRSLVLVDELGAGTDPQEGASLARAILEALVERSVTTLVATHYPELKTYAHVTQGVENASVEFDVDSLRPTFHLTIGIPGRSNALAIAKRLGLSGTLVEKARKRLAPEGQEADSLLDDIRRQRETARQASAGAERAHQQAEELRADLAKRLEDIDEERRAVLEEARREAAHDLQALKEELKDMRRRLAKAGQPLEALRSVKDDIEAMEDELEEPVERLASLVDPHSGPLQIGDRVRLPSLDVEGVITEIAPDHFEVQVGRLRVRTRADELVAVAAAPMEAVKRETSGARLAGVRTPSGGTPSLEVDLRGKIVEEAVEGLEQKLDSAFLAGIPFIRIIHGKGTGRLRQAIRQELKGNPYVASFRPGERGEGGEGVTVVFLAND